MGTLVYDPDLAYDLCYDLCQEIVNFPRSEQYAKIGLLVYKLFGQLQRERDSRGKECPKHSQTIVLGNGIQICANCGHPRL